MTPVSCLSYKEFIKIKEYSVRWKQVPICPSFSPTDYKVHGLMLTVTVLDLKDDPTAKGQDEHKKYCSIYLQLSWLRSLSGIHLLQKIDMKDLQFHLHDAIMTVADRNGKAPQT